MQFLSEVRVAAEGLAGRIHVDLTSVEEITPAGALLLVATFDRWRELVPKKKLRAVGINKWNPSVRRKLREMGFFSLLNADCVVTDPPEIDADQYLPFFTGHGSEGGRAKELRQSIESLGPEIADRDALYDGLVEAMTNVRQHAYSSTDKVKRWWMSASVNVSRNRLTVMFLDHGMSIPATLPRSRVWENVRGFLANSAAGALKDDAKMIEAAVTVEKSRTGDEYRGNGLRHDIRGYVESHKARGRLRILSRNGRCIYDRQTNGQTGFQVAHLKSPLKGTFLEWIIEEYSSDERNDD